MSGEDGYFRGNYEFFLRLVFLFSLMFFFLFFPLYSPSTSHTHAHRRIRLVKFSKQKLMRKLIIWAEKNLFRFSAKSNGLFIYPKRIQWRERDREKIRFHSFIIGLYLLECCVVFSLLPLMLATGAREWEWIVAFIPNNWLAG